MATSKPPKPQGIKPNKDGGNFVDPLKKWDSALPDDADFGEDKPTSKKDSKKQKETEEQKESRKRAEAKNKVHASLVNALVSAPDKAAEKIAALLEKLADPSLSTANRLLVRRQLDEAKLAFKKVSESADKVADELITSRRLEAQAYAKLNRIRSWKEQGDTAGLSKDDIQSVHDTEESLKEFITAMAVFRKGDNAKDEDVKKHMVSKLDKLLDRVDSMPDEFKEMFSDEEKQLDELLDRQREAREFVTKQNEQIKKALWKTADKIGFGALNVGNLVRSGMALWNLKKNTQKRIGSIRDKIAEKRDYIKKTIEMRQLAKANPVDGNEDPTLAPPTHFQDRAKERESTRVQEKTVNTEKATQKLGKEQVASDVKPVVLKTKSQEQGVETDAGNDDLEKIARKQNSLLERYLGASDRFRSRLLDRLGKKKKPEEKKEAEDGSFLKGLFGSGGLMKTLLGAVAKLSAVAIAGAIGYWVGSKIWEKIAPWAAEKFNNLSGLDQAGKNITAPVVLNTEDNFNRARIIEENLKKPGTIVGPENKDFYARFRFDNKDVDLSKPYAPSAVMKAANARRANQQGQSTEPIAPPPALPDTGAGAGRGFATPVVRAPEPADEKFGDKGVYTGPAPVTSGQGIKDAFAAKGGPKDVQTTSIPPIATQPTVNNGSQLMSDAIGKTMVKNGQVDVKGVNPNLQSNMVNMSQEYLQSTGKKLQINSAYRSIKEQEELYKTKPPGYAAKPGSSLHNFGLAIDVSSSQANELKNLGLLDKYGMTRPISKEPWHMQPAGVSIAAARAGVFSADAPADQGSGGNPKVASAKPQTQNVASAEPRVPVTDSSGSAVETGSGGQVSTVGGGKKSVADIPTFDTKDGHLMAMNLGAI